MGDVRLIPFKVEEIIDVPEEKVPRGVEMINAPNVWEESRKGEDVVVAVLDTGCELDHPDLKNRIIGGRNFTEDDGGDPDNFADNHYHGTHVAGTICAASNDVGVKGVAPRTKILVLKVLDEEGSGSYDGIIDAIHYAADWRGPEDEKVSVISMSLGGPNDIPELHDAIKKAVSKDILVVCAAGNAGDGDEDTTEIGYPGYYKEVVQVGAVNFEKEIAEFSNSNDELDLVAPGVNILSTYPEKKYAKLSGTSMATPHVSGAAALIINGFEKNSGRTITEPEIFAQLCEQAVPLGYSKKEEGNGLLQLTPYDEEEQMTYQITAKPVGDGYTVELGFFHNEKEAFQFAETLKTDLEKVNGVRVDTKQLEYAPVSNNN